MSDLLREKRIELILQQLDELPTLPAVAVKVLEVTGDETSSAKQVVELISSDQSLTARILQLVHRADQGVRGEVNSIERAVVLLGYEAVRSAVLAVSVFQTFPGAAQQRDRAVEANFNREEFWKHSVAVACCAELLAEAVAKKVKTAPQPVGLVRSAVEKIDPSEAFVCGLLHDLGKVALDAVFPKSFGKVVEATDLLRGNIADLERSVIGLDHMVIGKRLAERWQLPTLIRDCIWLHGQSPSALPATLRNPRLVNLITLADLIVREQHLGYSGNYVFPGSRQALTEAVGLSVEHVEDIRRQLIDHIEPRAKALGLGETNTSELYQQALAQANRELGRVSGQLVTKNRKLQMRAKFFDALSTFQAELGPDARPQGVLTAIGQTAGAVLDVRCCAVFSIMPGQAYAEAMLFDEQGEVFETTLVDCPAPMERTRPGEGPVLSAGPEMEWLVGAISPRLPHENRYWVPLQADGQCIGGVVWGAPRGEAERLSPQVQEIVTLATGWGLGLRMAQIREEARLLAEQLTDANRQLHNAQNEILQSKMMVSVGEMAAGAAHEMNNPLAVISGRSQLLVSQLTDPKLKAAAHLIFEQSHRLSEIISELMDFAKPTPAKPVVIEASDLVARAVHDAKMQTDPADRSIEVTMEDVPPVTVDVEQVAAAMVEILDNALHATDAAKGHVAIHGAYDPVSCRVVLSIADNGVGMDEHTLRRAFDPFFSSKPAGRRRGMGLAKALRWVQSSGGAIRMESELGRGTRTLVLLPAAQKPMAAAETDAVTPEWRAAQ